MSSFNVFNSMCVGVGFEATTVQSNRLRDYALEHLDPCEWREAALMAEYEGCCVVAEMLNSEAESVGE